MQTGREYKKINNTISILKFSAAKNEIHTEENKSEIWRKHLEFFAENVKEKPEMKIEASIYIWRSETDTSVTNLPKKI